MEHLLFLFIDVLVIIAIAAVQYFNPINILYNSQFLSNLIKHVFFNKTLLLADGN